MTTLLEAVAEIRREFRLRKIYATYCEAEPSLKDRRQDAWARIGRALVKARAHTEPGTLRSWRMEWIADYRRLTEQDD